MTKVVKAASLVLDYDLYPRQQIDTQHTAELRSALRAGVTLPPVVADRKSSRVTDGFHRIRATLAELGDDADIEVEFKNYKTDAEMFADAARMNAQHGRNLTSYDKCHCLIRAKALGLSVEEIAAALSITVDRANDISVSKSATLKTGKRATPEPVAIKRTIQHMAGQALTPDQQHVNRKLGGMAQLFYVNQLLMLIESRMLDLENDNLMAGLTKLRGLLNELLVPDEVPV